MERGLRWDIPIAQGRDNQVGQKKKTVGSTPYWLQWSHVVVNFAAGGTVEVFFNGISVGTKAGFSCATNEAVVSIGAVLPPDCVPKKRKRQLINDNFDGITLCPMIPEEDQWEGHLDMMYIWKRTLTAAEADALARGRVSPEQSCDMQCVRLRFAAFFSAFWVPPF